MSGKLGNGCINGIKDNSGNLRFLEGTPNVTQSIENIVKYAKWSLSGTHLMLVLAIYNDTGSDITISNYSNFCDFSLPSWMMDKIYPTNPTNNILGSVGVEGLSGIRCTKSSSGRIQFVTMSNMTIADSNAYRFQFDLLIDME